MAVFADQFSQTSPEGELTHLSKKGQKFEQNWRAAREWRARVNECSRC